MWELITSALWALFWGSAGAIFGLLTLALCISAREGDR